MSGEQNFWSRRRAGVEAEEHAEREALDAQTLAEEQAALEDKTDAEILKELDLPDPDTLTMGDDFSVFMSKAVPDRLRRRALRTLWRSNPVLANVDSLVDYGEDFTDAATVVENLQTTYQVGKGMLKHVQEMARKAEALAAKEDEAEEFENANVDAQDEPSVMPVEEPDRVASSETAQDQNRDGVETREGGEEPLPPTPRRMKFRIEESAA